MKEARRPAIDDAPQFRQAEGLADLSLHGESDAASVVTGALIVIVELPRRGKLEPIQGSLRRISVTPFHRARRSAPVRRIRPGPFNPFHRFITQSQMRPEAASPLGGPQNAKSTISPKVMTIATENRRK